MATPNPPRDMGSISCCICAAEKIVPTMLWIAFRTAMATLSCASNARCGGAMRPKCMASCCTTLVITVHLFCLDTGVLLSIVILAIVLSAFLLTTT